ncbi:MAG: KTSC domain-containing protein [Pseudazoarcus pumilus]|nr:KTSC domain-containing protein [Pseudazoarcus pumilus]
MNLKPLQSGKLRGAGYDARSRTLRVELEGGVLIDYANVGEEIWRRLSNSASAWSYYRDNVEEEFAGKRVSGESGPKRNPLDDLFGN